MNYLISRRYSIFIIINKKINELKFQTSCCFCTCCITLLGANESSRYDLPKQHRPPIRHHQIHQCPPRWLLPRLYGIIKCLRFLGGLLRWMAGELHRQRRQRIWLQGKRGRYRDLLSEFNAIFWGVYEGGLCHRLPKDGATLATPLVWRTFNAFSHQWITLLSAKRFHNGFLQW